MIAYLKGNLAVVKGDSVIVEVNGIGYKLAVPSSMAYKLPSIGETIFIHTYLHVREDAMLLYGFLEEEERELFVILQNVSGIGPKVALAILSTSSVSGFKQAVLQNQVAMLTQIPGIGQKTAQRMILELKDKLAKENLGMTGTQEPGLSIDNGEFADALNALVALGYNSAEAGRTVNKVVSAYKEKLEVEQIIKLALKELARG